MAPQLSQLDLYDAPELIDADIAQEFAKWANDPAGPLQMNASFGECEALPVNPVFNLVEKVPLPGGLAAGDSLEAAAEPILNQANLEGRTLFSSTGDTGGSCPLVAVPIVGAGNGLIPQPYPVQNYPAISTHVTGVGGTVVSTVGTPDVNGPAKRYSENGWTYGGGGQSFVLSEPAYQKGVAAINRPCLTNVQGVPYIPPVICRGDPDISAMSGTAQSLQSNALLDENFYMIESDMTASGEGGTSLASPLAVGMWARIQAAAPTAKGLGFANESFYKIGKSKTYSRDFTDITKSETPLGNFFYLPSKGWDYVSGWGSMNVTNLMKDLTGRLTPKRPKAQTKLPVALNGCVTYSSPEDNANNAVDPALQDPSLDIETGSLHISGGKNLIVTMSGQTLSKGPALAGVGGEKFVTAWTMGDKTYFAAATVLASGATTYTDGISGTAYSDSHSDVGSFGGGTIRIVVPLKNIGQPVKGDVLTYPYALAQNIVGAGSVSVLPFTEDVATAPQPGQGLLVGAPCKAVS